MGKDGTQLLRHCVRLLLVVATDLVSIRQSGKILSFLLLLTILVEMKIKAVYSTWVWFSHIKAQWWMNCYEHCL